MKILYLTPDFSNFYAAFYHGMIHSMDKYAEVTYYGTSFPLYNTFEDGRDLLKVVEKIGKPDVILMWDNQGTGWAGDFLNLDKIDCVKALWSVDIHKDAGAIQDAPQTLLQYIRSNGINLFLLTYDREFTHWASQTFKKLNLPIEFYPFSIDPNFYKPLNLSKKYDVSLLGNTSGSYYPYRHQYLNMFSGTSEFRFHHSGIAAYYREDFVRHINESKICLTCTGSNFWPMPKYFEVMSCGGLLFGNKPTDAEYLHFIDGVNYVDVNPNNVLEKIHYYLSHEGEAEVIRSNARQTILNYHTDDIRGRELVEVFKKYVK